MTVFVDEGDRMKRFFCHSETNLVQCTRFHTLSKRGIPLEKFHSIGKINVLTELEPDWIVPKESD